MGKFCNKSKKGRNGSNGNGSNGKKGSNSTASSTPKKPRTIEDVHFDVGDAKKAANASANVEVLIAHIRQSEQFGIHRQWMADALEDDKADAPVKPKLGDCVIQRAMGEDNDSFTARQKMSNGQFSRDVERCEARVMAYENNTRAAASLMHSKCSTVLQQRIKNRETLHKLMRDALKMKEAIRSHATAPKLNAHPLIHVIDAFRALFGIRQQDDVSIEDYGKNLTSAKKTLTERLGCKLVPVKCMETLDGYDVAKKAEFETEAWNRLIAVIGVQGANDTKCKSMKEDLKVSHANKRNEYPVSVAELKPQLDARKWDANPNNKKKDNGSSSNGKDKGKPEASAIEKAARRAGAQPNASFYQQSSKEKKGHCCGSKNHLLPNCPHKDTAPKNQWYQVTGKCMFQEIAIGDAPSVVSAIGNTPSVSGASTLSRQSARAGVQVCQVTVPMKMGTCMLNGKALKTAVLLDNQSTTHVFAKKEYLHSIEQMDQQMDLSANGGVLKLNHMGQTQNFGSVWYDSRAIANVLSFSLVREQVGPQNIGYDPVEDKCWVEVNDQRFEFRRSEEGLYHHWLPDGAADGSRQHSFLELEEENRKLCTHREHQQALKARKLLHAAGHPHPDDLIRPINANQIANCPVTVQDFKTAKRILGPDISSLKGKATRRKPIPAVTEQVEVPTDLHPDETVALCMDVLFVNKTPFLSTISKKIHCQTCLALKAGKKADSFNAGLDNALRVHNQGGFMVSSLHADGEFGALLKPLDEKDEDLSPNPIKLDLSPAQAHEPDIERSNRLIKERTRSAFHRLPLKAIPKIMVIALVEDSAHKTNLFPSKAGLSPHHSPRQIVEKQNLDFEKHLKFSFGSYVLASEETANSLKARMIDCIHLAPDCSSQAGHHLHNLHAKAVITRHTVVPAPMTQAVIDLVHKHAEADGVDGLKFHTKHKEVIWDSSLLAGVDHQIKTTEPCEDGDEASSTNCIYVFCPIFGATQNYRILLHLLPLISEQIISYPIFQQLCCFTLLLAATISPYVLNLFSPNYQFLRQMRCNFAAVFVAPFAANMPQSSKYAAKPQTRCNGCSNFGLN